MGEVTRVLIVEDLPSDAELCEHEVRKTLGTCEFRRTETRQEFLAGIRELRPDVIISDYKLPQFDGLTALRLAAAHAADVPFIMLTGSMNEDTAVDCMKAGAWDYVIKEHIKRLGPAVLAAMEQKAVRDARRQAEKALRLKNLVFDASIAANLITDSDGVITELNETALRLWKRPDRAGIIGQNVARFFQNPNEAATVMDTLARVGQWEGDFTAVRLDSSTFVAHGLATALRDETGELVGYQAAVTDITERKQTERALRERRKELRCLVNVSSVLGLPGISLEEQLRQIVLLLPPAWEVPEITEACIEVGEQSFQTAGFRETPWMETATIEVEGKVVGQVRVSLREDKAAADATDFLNEEAALLEAVAVRLGQAISRRRTDESLRESEERFRLIVENSTDVIFMLNREGEFTYFSPSVTRVLGYGQTDLIGRAFSSVVHPEDAPLIEEAIGQSIEQGQEVPGTPYRVRHASGDWRWHSAKGSAVRNAQGQAIGFSGVAHDTTESRLAEARLALLSQRNELLLNSTAEGIVGLDAKGKHTFVNPAAARMLGWKAEELLASAGHGIWHHAKTDGGAYPEETCQILRSVSAATTVRRSDEVFWRKDGTSFPVEYVSTPVIQNGRSWGAVVTFLDNTERQGAEALLRQNEEKFRAAFMTGLDGFYLATLEDGLILEVNDNFERVFGYSREEAVGRTSLQLGLYANPADRARAVDLLKSKGYVRDLEVEGVKKGGVGFTASLSITLLTLEGKSRILGIVRDITDRKRAEQEIQRGYERLQKTVESSIQAIAATAEARDPYTAGHQRRVARLARAIAVEMGLSAERTEGLHVAAMLHDIGKIGVPSEILSKPGRLSDIEMSLIKTHAQAGGEILKGLDLPWAICPIVTQHHERLDGSGYPAGIGGEDIGLEARILGVADVVEAMASNRPYRPAVGVDKALAEVAKNRGKLYDADAVDACLRLFNEKGFALD